MKPFRYGFCMLLGLVAFAAGNTALAGQAAPLPAQPMADAYSDSALAQGLESWNRLSQRKAHLESENLAWEARFNPDREDHNWWNPFWRSTAERHLEQSNALSLQILALERQRAEWEPRLLEWSGQYAQSIPTRLPKLSASDRQFWFAVDAWRFPIWLHRLQDLRDNLARNAELGPELQQRRRQSLEQLWSTAKSLDAYLSWRQGQLTPAEASHLQEQQAWQRQIQTWLAAVASLR